LETKTHKLDVRLTQNERDGLELLAADRGRSLGAEVRAAIDAWLQLAPWLDDEPSRADT
jgi:hypothetical protein